MEIKPSELGGLIGKIVAVKRLGCARVIDVGEDRNGPWIELHRAFEPLSKTHIVKPVALLKVIS